MKKVATLYTIALSFMTLSATSQKAEEKTPTVQDLDFLIGKWEITFEFYDTHDTTRGVYFTEEGFQICEYDLAYNGTPRYIVCQGELKAHGGKFEGRTREIYEAIRYGRFENSFERIGLYSNWPATGLEILKYDSAKGQFIIRGQLNVQNNMLERYIDTYQFNEDYTYFDRTNIANFSDMPFTEYNLTLKGTGRKVK
ncbi:MAG: hypothetical protein ABJG78_06210 [Cyclobacteriaceae bacterium]